ncbi:MAG TPA: hypothetical protein DF715_08980 [Oceanicaulis sp.]|nr:hypothetical protein [Oceanicaulis sp.]
MLFRREVLEARSDTGMGEVVIVQPRILAVMTIVFSAITFGVAIFAVFAEFSRRETVVGYLAPEGGIATITPVGGGVVAELFVEEGQTVSAGEPVIRLSTELFGAEGGSASSQRAEIESRISELQLQRDAQIQQFDQQQERLHARLISLASELDRLTVRAALASESVEVAEAQLARWRDLADRGFATRADVDQRRQGYLAALTSKEDIDALIIQRRSERREVQHALEQLPLERDIALSRLRSEAAALSQARQELDRAAGYVLSAPVSGQITAMQAQLGATVRPDQPLAAILPDGQVLQGYLLVPTSAAGFIANGQDVRLRVDAFNYQRFGTLNGHVTEVSTSALSPLEVAGPIPVAQPVYRLRVELRQQSLSAYGEERPLQAGMTVMADVIVDRRPLWRWFVDPVLAARSL